MVAAPLFDAGIQDVDLHSKLQTGQSPRLKEARSDWRLLGRSFGKRPHLRRAITEAPLKIVALAEAKGFGQGLSRREIKIPL
jgi:hypothetical protein